MHVLDNLHDIPDRIRRLGVYKLNGKYYTNKFKALEDAGKNYVQWIFNDEEFAKYDFSVEPEGSLYDLYAKRAHQIRGKYDNVIVYFSGGIDSTAVLRSFVDNNIPIDAVVVYGAWGSRSEEAKINRAEQERVAIPYLKELEKERNIKLNVYFLDIIPYHDYSEGWIYHNSYNLVPACTAFSNFDQDRFMQEMMMSGNTCAVRGIDKPRLIFENGLWKMAFLDVTLGGVTSFSNYQERPFYLLDEFFFWSPDMPELIAKQAHVLAKEFETKFDQATCDKMFTRTNKFDKRNYGNLTEPVVYGRYVQQEIGEDRPYFYLPPAFSGVINPKSWWFFKERDDLKKKDNELFVRGISDLKSNIDPMHFNKVPDEREMFSKWLGVAPLDNRIVPEVGGADPLFGTVGCWSPDYFIKKYDTYR